jgi:hypothetical protein
MCRFASFFLFIILLNACNSKVEQETAIDAGYTYFPLIPGAERVYAVDSINYDNNAFPPTIDTFHYWYREIVEEFAGNTKGLKTYHIARYRADSLGAQWNSLNTWTASAGSDHALRTEENTTFLKLVFPVHFRQSWKRNLYNTGDQEATSRIDEVDVPFSCQAGVFPNTIRVLHEENMNVVEEILKYERYAKGVGLVYALHDSINTQVIGAKGYRIRFTLHSFR